MKTIEVEVPKNCVPSILGFVTALIEKTQEFTSEDISVKINDGTAVDAKSILGLTSLNFANAKNIVFTVLGPMEDYAAPRLETFVNKLLDVYVRE